jgi:hypothetical protein
LGNRWLTAWRNVSERSLRTRQWKAEGDRPYEQRAVIEIRDSPRFTRGVQLLPVKRLGRCNDARTDSLGDGRHG